MSDFSFNISGFVDLTKKLNELGVKADEQELASLFEYESKDKGCVKVEDFSKDVATLYDFKDYDKVCDAIDETADLFGDDGGLSVQDAEIAKENEFNSLINDENIRNTLIEILNGHVSFQSENLARIEDKNDGFTKFFDGVVGFFGGNKSTVYAEKDIDEAKSLVASLEKTPEKLPEVYKKITGNDLTPEELERICNKKQDYSNSEITKSVDNYQKMWNDKVGIDVGVLPSSFSEKASELQDAINNTGMKIDMPKSDKLISKGKDLKSNIEIKRKAEEEAEKSAKEEVNKFFGDENFRVRLDNKMGYGFSSRFESVCKNINCEPDDLLAVMCSESRLDPTVVNPSTSTTGLIQISPSSAAELGTTTYELAQMSAVEQLDYVEKFFQAWNGNEPPEKKLDAGTLYTTIFLPAYRNYDDDAVLCQKGDAYYSGNEGLDMNQDGIITKRDITDRMRSMNIDEFVP